MLPVVVHINVLSGILKVLGLENVITNIANLALYYVGNEKLPLSRKIVIAERNREQFGPPRDMDTLDKVHIVYFRHAKVILASFCAFSLFFRN